MRGYALWGLEQNQEAKFLLEKARAVAAAAHLSSVQSKVLFRLGNLQLSLGETAKAEELYTSALAQADTARDSYLQARAYEALGYIDLKNSRYDECAISSARALHTYQTLGAEIRTATVSVNLGWCDYRLGNQEDAQALFAIAQRLFIKHKQWRSLSINLNDNGAAAVARRDLPAARDYYRTGNRTRHENRRPATMLTWPRQPRYDVNSDGGCGCRRGHQHRRPSISPEMAWIMRRAFA